MHISKVWSCVPWNVVKKKENKQYENECATQKDKRKYINKIRLTNETSNL